MTPLQIQMMLHYYAIAEPYAMRQPAHANSMTAMEQRQWLIDAELIVADAGSSGFKATDRGVAYVEALCALPFPIKKWVMPDATTFCSKVDKGQTCTEP